MRLFIRRIWSAGLGVALGTLAGGARGEGDLAVYGDSLLNGFEEPHGVLLNLTNPAPVHSGACSISVSPAANGQGIFFHHPGFDTTPYASLSFWVLGSNSHAPRLLVQGLLGDGNPPVDVYYRFTAPAGNWRQVTIPLALLGISRKTNCTGFWIQLVPNEGGDALYFDDIEFDAARAAVSVSAPAADGLPAATARDPGRSWNVAVWCIAGALTMMTILLLWLVLLLQRRGAGASQALVPVAGTGLPEISWGTDGLSGAMSALLPAAVAGMDDAQARRLRERVAVELAEFAKQSLIQGLYSQRSQLLENQQKAQEELANLEARLAMLQLPLQERIRVYEQRIAELEKQLETRDREMHDMIEATLSLVRERLETEKAKENVDSRLN